MVVEPPTTLIAAIDACVPDGRWAVAVSGGVDSVALLRLLDIARRWRSGLFLHVVHLDHQTRGEASTGDAAFVADLSRHLNLPCTIALRADVESGDEPVPANLSERYRAARHALFRRVVAANGLFGVILAHHADDQAETILHRLIRGSGIAGLSGMKPAVEVAGLKILRPLLEIRRVRILEFLAASAHPWREDASNESPAYLRNRLRTLLRQHPQLIEPLLTLARNSAAVLEWSRSSAPALAAEFPASELQRLPDILARESARRWLLDQGAKPRELARSPRAVDRLVNMARDAASPPGGRFPGTSSSAAVEE